MELARYKPIRLLAGVDIDSQRSPIDAYLHQKGFDIEMLYFKAFDSSHGLRKEQEQQLDSVIKRHSIDGVIISTEPLAHAAYASWALKRGLHILMDKPVSVRKFANIKPDQAKALLYDYKHLLNLYEKAQRVRPTIFSINVQRRYDHGFNKVKDLIAEAKNRFNVPPTSIQAMHADGTWVFPNEILTQQSHPYFNGYGKCSHSGYHIFDMAWELYKAGIVEGKYPDTMEVFSSFLSPRGFSLDMSKEDYASYFDGALSLSEIKNDEYLEKIRHYGEIDSFGIVRLLKNNENMCNVSINLMHSSLSQRSWFSPREDLYKGNGRVKHQQFTIQQGPFQCVQIHNYQSQDQHDIDNSEEYEIGGNNHFDILLFRNVKMFGSGQAYTKISAKDLESESDNRLLVEKAKDRVLIEFLDFLEGKIEKNDLKSNIDSQLMPVLMMTGMYLSNACRHKKKNPLVSFPIPPRSF